MEPLQVGILLYHNVGLLDFVGVFESLSKARYPVEMDANQYPLFDVFTIASTKDPILTDSGLLVTPQQSFEENPYMDIFVIPGGVEARFMGETSDEIYFIQHVSETTQPIATVNTGAFLYAKAGLGDSRRMVTHYQHAEEFQRLFPKIKVKLGYRYLDDGLVISAAGSSSSIDLGLYLVYKYYGIEAAENTSRLLEYHFTP